MTNQASARPPMRPSAALSPMWAMPATNVEKTSGAMIILISLMKASPSGFILAPSSGWKWPSSTPTVTANRTWTYRDL